MILAYAPNPTHRVSVACGWPDNGCDPCLRHVSGLLAKTFKNRGFLELSLCRMPAENYLRRTILEQFSAGKGRILLVQAMDTWTQPFGPGTHQP